MAFLIPIIILLILAIVLLSIKVKRTTLYAKEGFLTVGLSWIILSLFGAIPFIVSNTLPNFFDAFFETVSGFTTTGSSVISNVEKVNKSILLWRSISIWLGGMGVLAFIIAVLPHTDARSIYMIKAESPGPKVGKLVSKVKFSTRILYLIYILLTLVFIIFLAFKIPIFDSVCYALSGAGTGGFAIHNLSIAHYNSLYVEIVTTVFLFLFGINFSIFYFILIGNYKEVLKNEELKNYILVLFTAIILIAFNTINIYGNFFSSLRYSAFQATSIMTTTGFSTFDFNNWPAFSKWILIILMFTGASAGSTSGGIKMSRIIIYFKTVIKEIKYSIHPKQISIITFEGKPLDEATQKSVSSFLAAYLIVLLFGVLLISIDGKDLITNFTAILASLSNVGPGLEIVGPLGNYASFSNFSKFILSIIMLIGRLELFPIFIIFSPRLWLSK